MPGISYSPQGLTFGWAEMHGIIRTPWGLAG
jgi:hypothetical protein